ncbi:DUF2924 domain-containing protein [Rhodospirillaceae bacterium SYSU D60014]|uniref:DUF2924 domain-containing protein n=1 Tax=Virgifigura deserti TaxID=2268457 RepID=UPI000E66701A
MSQEKSTVDRRFAAIAQCDVPSLRAEWAALFGHAAPAHLSRDLLIRALAYRIQEQAGGGLRPATRRQLRRLADDLRTSAKTMNAPSRPTLRPGVRLMRDWNGGTEVVEVLADGFAWRGQEYRSLSAIARAITGVRWSGPRFFGLTAPPRAPADGKRGG